MTEAKQQTGEEQPAETNHQSERPPESPRPTQPNQTGYGYGNDAAALVQVLNREELPKDIRRMIEAELNPDHILSNLNDAEIRYRRFSIWNNKEIVMGSFPPRKSLWQGERRKEANALNDARSALTVEQIHSLRDAFDAAYARVARSRNGWQQDKLADQTEERRIVEERKENDSGFLSKIMG